MASDLGAVIVRSMFDDAEMLAKLLELWRATRDPAVADLIDRVAPERAPFRPWMKSYERRRRWRVVAARRDPCEVPALLCELHSSLEPLDALETWPDDPRIATWLAARCVYTTWAPRIERACTLLRRLADRRTIAPLIAAGPPWSEVANEVARAPWTVADHTELAAALDARDAARATAARELAQRLGRIYDAPADLAERSVLADWLIERGDPRGELIALQLAPPTRAGRLRARELIARHADTWQDDLGYLVSGFGRRFRNGFLDSCSVDVRRINTTTTARAWATVRHVELRHDGWRGRTFAPVLPALVSLYTLADPAAATLAALAHGARPELRRLRVAAHLLDELGRADRELPRVPRLRHLSTAIEPRSWIVGSSLWRRCEVVSLRGSAKHLGDWFAVLQRSPHLRSLRLDLEGRRCVIANVRITPHGRLQLGDPQSGVIAGDQARTLTAALQSLPARAFAIVECPPALRGLPGIADELARIAR
jgi:uncharacterized protein (TIGR02996 family)